MLCSFFKLFSADSRGEKIMWCYDRYWTRKKKCGTDMDTKKKIPDKLPHAESAAQRLLRHCGRGRSRSLPQGNKIAAAYKALEK